MVQILSENTHKNTIQENRPNTTNKNNNIWDNGDNKNIIKIKSVKIY